jgi:hypothetical protein
VLLSPGMANAKEGLSGCAMLVIFALVLGLLVKRSCGDKPEAAPIPKASAVAVEMHDHDAGSALSRKRRCTIQGYYRKPVTGLVDGGTIEIASNTKCEVDTYGRRVPVLLLDGPHAGLTVSVWGSDVRRDSE